MLVPYSVVGSLGKAILKSPDVCNARYMHIIPFIAIGAAIVLNIVGSFIMHLYDASADVIAISLNIIRIYGCMLPILMLNNLIVVGILRSGGDARFSLFLMSVDADPYPCCAGRVCIPYFPDVGLCFYSARRNHQVLCG